MSMGIPNRAITLIHDDAKTARITPHSLYLSDPGTGVGALGEQGVNTTPRLADKTTKNAQTRIGLRVPVYINFVA
ncbi:hypothetical protein [Tateyamaria sp. SN3-11]|uniref:hypothetical protein n=1 Tax=Tateyamaria sp. SN3-11 TaxID=3092147 RepID=UPI0039EC95C6